MLGRKRAAGSLRKQPRSWQSARVNLQSISHTLRLPSCWPHPQTAQTYGILWTNLDTGKGMRPLLSGGTRSRGLDAGSLTTFWNVGQAAGAVMRLGPRSDFGPWINFIGGY